jgi:hypothetical protein
MACAVRSFLGSIVTKKSAAAKTQEDLALPPARRRQKVLFACLYQSSLRSENLTL